MSNEKQDDNGVILSEDEKAIQLRNIHVMAKILDVPLSRLYRETMKRGEGAIPCIRIGKYIKFEPEKVIEWFRQKTTAMQTA